MKTNHYFSHFARRVSVWTGHPLAFLGAVLVIVVWLISGPVFHFSDTWQLVINTGTTIVTFLMVFLIQHSQNHDTAAIHVKLDELIRAVKEARNSFIDLENAEEEDIQKLLVQFRELAAQRASESGVEDSRETDANPH